jgi:predicted transcriptional regulator
VIVQTEPDATDTLTRLRAELSAHRMDLVDVAKRANVPVATLVMGLYGTARLPADVLIALSAVLDSERGD